MGDNISAATAARIIRKQGDWISAGGCPGDLLVWLSFT
jgi:hypothetical protein